MHFFIGCAGSGKSTLYKQMALVLLGGFPISVQENVTRNGIYHFVEIMRTLIEKVANSKDYSLTKENRVCGRIIIIIFVLRFM